MDDRRLRAIVRYIMSLCVSAGLAYGLGLEGTGRSLLAVAEIAHDLLLKECEGEE